MEAILAEIETRQDYITDKVIRTLYFGGGTPSILNQQELGSIKKKVERYFGTEGITEITLEANPEDLTSQKIQELRSVGINRLSIGIQSFDTQILKYLNRAHTSNQAIKAVENAQKAGFDNISIDLIYGIPQRTGGAWEKEIESAINLGVQHISAYCLTIEEKTVFGHWKRQNKLIEQDEDVALSEFQELVAQLERNGFDHYEISNFAKPNFYAQHNTNYWKNAEYLGLGPGAHSYNLKTRHFNISNNHQYVQRTKNLTPTGETELLSPVDRINEYLLTSIRTKWGCSFDYLDKFGLAFEEKKHSELRNLIDAELVCKENGVLFLTKKGKFLADYVTECLFIEDI